MVVSTLVIGVVIPILKKDCNKYFFDTRENPKDGKEFLRQKKP